MNYISWRNTNYCYINESGPLHCYFARDVAAWVHPDDRDMLNTTKQSIFSKATYHHPLSTKKDKKSNDLACLATAAASSWQFTCLVPKPNTLAEKSALQTYLTQQSTSMGF